MEQSLRTLGGVMNGDLAALRHLNDRATSHNHHNLDVRPEFYPLWKDALLVSVQYYDPAFCPGIKEAWDVILDEAIRFMTKRY